MTPPHLIDLPGSAWSLWRWTCVRGAGFPAWLVLRLADPDAAGAANSMLDAEHVADRSRADAARVELESVFAAANARVSTVIREIARDPSFREAVAWQNRAVLERALAPLLAREARTSDQRRQDRKTEELIANYVQRYCTKNDTIGFFGPTGWATWSDTSAALVACSGSQLVDHRAVHFEHWAIDALAATIARDPRIEPYLAPRRHAFVRCDGSRAHSAVSGWHELPMRLGVVLAACTGTHSARVLAAKVLRDHPGAFADEGAVFATLRELRELQLVAWTLEIPMSWDGERRLRELVMGVEDAAARAPALALVDELAAARDRVAASAGDQVALDRALATLDETFARATGQAPTRNAGMTYGSRTTVFEDTRRDVEVVIGRAVLDALASPLGLVLDSARWLAHQIGQAFRAELRRIYAAARGHAGGRTVPLSDIWFPLQRSLHGTKDRLFDAPLAELQRRWAALVPIPAGARRVAVAADRLRDGVAHAFAAPDPGWAEARHQSPDIMIAAAGVDAVVRGQFELVLGELHLAVNTIDSSFVAEHPRPEELHAATIADLPDPRIIVVPPRDWPRAAVRTLPMLVAAKDYYLETGFEVVPGSRDRVLVMAELVVEDAGDDLVVRSTTGELTMSAIEFFGYLLSRTVVSVPFRMLPPAAHLPRVSIDRLVVQRETWTFQPAETGLDCSGESELAVFVAARRWSRAHGLPRFVYVKTTLETKPMFVDLESPIFARLLARLVRRAQAHVAGEVPVVVTEMLPRPDQLWLPGPHGETYTSELRIAAVDRQPPRGNGS